MSAAVLDKGKGKALPQEQEHLEAEKYISSGSSSDSDTDSDSDSSNDSASDSEEEITQEQLDSLLERARQNALSRSSNLPPQNTFEDGADMIQLGDDEESDAKEE